MHVLLTNRNNYANIHDIMHSLARAIDAILEYKWSFLTAFFIFFTVSYGLLALADLLPESPKAQSETVASTTPTITVATTSPSDTLFAGEVDALPNTMTIERLNRTVPVLNPASRSIEALDSALLEGVVRHPDSATMKDEGNIFILGHSSYLPVVNNRSFQAFNGIQDLVWGDVITIASADVVSAYRVEKVYKAKASALTIPVAGEGKRLTLATCNSFGSTDDRYIVEAELVSSKAR
jgi:LPXTG-site transpeptidase (sortase) family protein